MRTRRGSGLNSAQKAAIQSVCLLACLAGKLVFPAGPADDLTAYVHNSWQTENGLPQNAVHAVLQTKDGYLWIGTQEGLVRFDGVRFILYNKLNTPAFTNHHIQSLLETRDGALWACTFSGGIVRLKGEQFSSFTTENGLAGNHCTALYEDREGAVWAGTQGHGLSRLANGRSEHFTIKQGLANNHVLSITGTPDGSIWVGTNSGLSRIRGGAIRTYSSRDGLRDTQIKAVLARPDGGLWVGTNRGLHRLEGDRVFADTPPDGPALHAISALHLDQSATLWIATEGGGVYRLKEGIYSHFTSREGLTTDFVLSVFRDREGSVWLGTYGGGLSRLKREKFQNITTLDGLPGNFIRTVFEDSRGTLWVGTNGEGLAALRGPEVRVYSEEDGLAGKVVMSVAEDRRGDIWIGTTSGLNRLANGRLSLYTSRNGLPHDSVRVLYEDRNGNLWIGTRGGGLSLYRDGKFSNYGRAAGLADDTVRCIREDSRGNLWIGTNNGLNLIKNGQWQTFTTEHGLSHNTVYDIHEDAEGILWFGTYGGGLNRFKDGIFKPITTRDGLFDDVVFRILEDGRGNLWMTCNRGIFRHSRSELNAFADGRIKELRPVAYGSSDGMRTSECNGSSQPSGWRTRDGWLLFPTLKGVAAINPDSLHANSVIPPVAIEQILVNQNPVGLSQASRIPAGARQLEFHYTALSLFNPEKVQLKYRLEGYDDQWIDAGSRRQAYYMNIPPGRYRFSVIACNNDGLWNEEGASLDIGLMPHFHQTPWFYLVCVVSAAGMAAAAWSLRVRRVRVRERELTSLVDQRTAELQREVAERKQAELEARTAKRAAEAASRGKSEFLANMSHEIRTPMNGIIGMADLAFDTGMIEEQGEYLQTIKSSAESLLTIINDILDFSKIEAGRLDLENSEFSLREQIDHTLGILAFRAQEKGLELTCGIHRDVLDTLIGDFGRLRQIILNLVGNAVKFTEAGDIMLDVRLAEQTPAPANPPTPEVRLQFSVRDTGIGIPVEKQQLIFEAFRQADASATRLHGGTGLGLSISARLVEMMGGKIWVESEPGRGSVFHFTVTFQEAKKQKTLQVASHLQGLRALVVDDHERSRRVVADMLASFGLDVDEACDGLTAVSRVAQSVADEAPYVFVLWDACMPGADVGEIAEQLSALDGFAGRQILMFHPGSQSGKNGQSKNVPMIRLAKPVRHRELLEALDGGKSAKSLRTAPADAPPAARESGTGPLRILLAEDNLVNQRVALRLLERRGHKVFVVENGRLAVEAAERGDYDLILMDVQMPVMDGYEATARIRRTARDESRHPIPIFAMTAHAMKGDREKCLEAGMNDYLAKPLNKDALFAMIESVRSNGGQDGQLPQAAPFPEQTSTIPSDPQLCP